MSREALKTMRTPILVALLLCACGGGEAPATGATPPPVGTPPVGTPPVGTPPVGTPPGTPPGTPAGTPPAAGTVMVTVSAGSTPPGATVTGGGTLLGTTPFVTAVPVPAPTPGVTQTFEFTFQYPGYNPTTITASPTNGTITLNAVLAPAGVAVGLPPGGVPPGTPPGLGVVPPPPGGAAAPGSRFTTHGTAGGSIYDYHTTTATADVTTMCRIRELRVDVEGRHTFNSDLVVRLRGPDGEAYSLQSHNRRNPFRTHTVRRAAGHSSAGRWVLEVEDTVGADSGSLTGWSLDITCS